MATYNMPPDTSSREKLVGGILDMPQLIFLLIGLALGMAVGFILKIFGGLAGLIIGLIPGIALGLTFGFYKKKGLSLFDYIRYNELHKRKTKKLPNTRVDGLDKEDISKIRNY